MIAGRIKASPLLSSANSARQPCLIAHCSAEPTPAPAPGTRHAARWRRAARAAHRVTRRETHAARIRLDPPPAATLSSPRPGPVPPHTGQRDRPDSCGSRHFRIPAACALNGTQAQAGRDASPSPAAVTSGPDDPAYRTPNADPAASSARFRRALPAPRSGGSRIAWLGRHRARRRRPWREKAGLAEVPYRQLFRTPLRLPADTGTPGTRGMRRQCPE